MKIIRTVFLLLLILGIAQPCVSFAASKDDVRVVIDVSGSMLKTDPNNLRIPAVRMINGLIPSGANAGIWTFGRYVNMEVPWGTVDKKWRSLADAGAAKIHSRGQFTNIESALLRASKGWDNPDPNTERNLILLTDGQVDISKQADKNSASRETILNKVIPDLVKKGIKVHAIALSSQSDEALLKRLARQTTGSFEVANSANDLQRIFLRMFERATKPDTVPIEGNKFTVDKSINEMTLLIFRKGKKATGLIQPNKTEHSQQKHGKEVSWRNDSGYDLITVTKPEAGEWRLDVETDPDNRVMIVTDLKLEVDELPAFLTPDQSIDIKVELQEKGKKISKQSFLKFVDFKLTHSVGENQEDLKIELKKSLDINDKGIYLQEIAQPLDEGTHELVINADSRTFSRSKRYSIQVQWPVMVSIKKTDYAGIYSLSMKARDEYIKPKTLSLIARFKSPDGSKQLIDLEARDGTWSGTIIANKQDGLHQLMIHVQATTLQGKSINHEMETYSVLGIKQEIKEEPDVRKETIAEFAAAMNGGAPEIQVIEPEPQDSASNNDSDSWMSTVIMFSAVNIVLLLIGGGAFWYMRQQSKKNEVDLLGESDEVDPEEDLFGD